MKYDLDIRIEGDVFLVCITGTRTRETVIAASKDIMEAWSTSSTTKLLIDVRNFPGQLRLIDDYEVPAKEFATLPHRARLKAAAVVDLPENDARFELFEDVARARDSICVCSVTSIARGAGSTSKPSGLHQVTL